LLQNYTGIDVRTVPNNDEKVMKLFTSTESLGVTPDDIFSPIGTYGMPECGTSYVRQMMEAAKPKCFSDLLQISGLSHGTGIWLGNGEELIKNGTCTISEIIGTRDSIMLYLADKGVENGLAFKIMESVRKGKGLTPQFEEAMRASNVPEWYIASCKKIKYMFPKAHAAAYMISALRLGWYKVYKPIAFYAAHFTVKQTHFDAEIAMDKKNLKNLVKTLDSTPNLDVKGKGLLAIMQLVLEMYARGIDFLPVDVYKSEAFAFVPEDGKIRLPLSSLNGLGENAAKKIREVITSGAATTVEELKTAAGLSKTVVETLENAGCLANMPKSAQLSLFDF
jgi:DNA polymerase-3 subunit alpha (Gram-positive type)